jgi:ankyrin repeat protein
MITKQMLLSALILGATSNIIVSMDPTKNLSSDEKKLHKAAGLGDFETVKRLFEAGVPINIEDQEGFTILHKAIRCLEYPSRIKSDNERKLDDKNCLRTASIILRRDYRFCDGVLTDKPSHTGNTAAHLAAEKCNHKMLHQLQSYGHDLNQENNDGIYPITLARKAALKTGYYKSAFKKCQKTVDYLKIYVDYQADLQSAKNKQKEHIQ